MAPPGGNNRERKSEGEDEERFREFSNEDESNRTAVADPLLSPSSLSSSSSSVPVSSHLAGDVHMSMLQVLDCDPLEDFPLTNSDLMNLEKVDGAEEESENNDFFCDVEDE